MLQRRTILAALLAAITCLGASPSRPPKLLLVIVVDQFRYDYLLRFRDHYTGGIARLLQSGAVFTNAHHEHFPTVTAIGHSVLLTGAPPSATGIVGNEWYDRESHTQVTSVSDSSVALLGAPGKAGSSPRRLLGSSIGDELKMSGRGSPKIFGMSLKDRSAILPPGRMANGAFWYDAATGNFVSSTYYFQDLPQWVKQFNARHQIDAFAGMDWKPLLDGTPLLRLPPLGPSFFNGVITSPFASEVLELLAEDAVKAENLGRGDGTDLLAVSFSSNDYVGHRYGPESPHVRDISIRTDRLLDKFFQFIDAQVGLDNSLVVFTADHGVAPMPEAVRERGIIGGRLPEQTVLGAIEKQLTSLYGPGAWVVGKSGPAPYLNHDLIREKKLDIAQVRNAAADAVRRLPHILRVYTYEQMAAGQLPGDRTDMRIRNGFHLQRGSDLFVVSEPYWLFEESGTSHGTPHNYDSHVPIILMGHGIKPGRYQRTVATVDLAPTLAALLQIEIPSGAVGRILDEALP